MSCHGFVTQNVCACMSLRLNVFVHISIEKQAVPGSAVIDPIVNNCTACLPV